MVPIALSSVETFTQSLKSLIHQARIVGPHGEIGQPLERRNFGDRVDQIGEAPSTKVGVSTPPQYAAIETAARDILYDLIATTSITDPAFSQAWKLLDIITLVSDADRCEPGLAFWLVEELLDTQTIDGCRVVFDYLESRRERMCAHRLSKKSLIILRLCNELLRRLSRAEDTVFCGRVFIYLFQSFPLGDRSSVNLRGEYHIENVTTFDTSNGKLDTTQQEPMDVSSSTELVTAQQMGTTDTVRELSKPATNGTGTPNSSAKVGNESDEASMEQDPDRFYTDFWSLQGNFAMPTRLFDEENFKQFKEGMGSTMRRFKSVDQAVQTRNTSSPVEEVKRNPKRKRGDQQEELIASFNPKYLTSRDLFDLEISDLAFRRHILVQALILIDFLLSLTPKAKKKVADKSNKSVLYGYTLSQDDTKWATQTRSDIATYLQDGPEGKFYYRMVNTVLSRDKNWAQWKAEGCPNMKLPPVSAENFSEARKGAQKACATKRLRANPLGSVSLDFLSEAGNGEGLKKLTDPERYSIPPIESFKASIAEDDFDIEMARDEDEKQAIRDAKASKIWRTLRIASRSKFKLFHKIEDGNNPEILFEPRDGETRGNGESNGVESTVKDPLMIDPEHPISSDSLLEIPQ